MPGISEFLFGGPDTFTKLDNGSPQQQAFHNDLLSRLMGMSSQGGGMDLANNYFNQLLGPNQGQAFDQFSQPYMQQFNEQMLPQIAERFAGAGALSSSGFGQALGGAASGLQGQLAALFSQLQGQAAGAQYGQYNQMANTGLNYKPFDYRQKQGSTGMLGTLASGIIGGMGGPLGASLAGGISSGIGSLFKSKPSGNNTINEML